MFHIFAILVLTSWKSKNAHYVQIPVTQKSLGARIVSKNIGDCTILNTNKEIMSIAKIITMKTLYKSKDTIRHTIKMLKNKDKHILKINYLQNTDKIKANVSKNRKANVGKYNSIKAKYKAKKKMAVPKWLTPQHLMEIENIYVEARRLGLEVDHIVPINSDIVCGLHVPWNLQLLPKAINASKGNKLLENAHTASQNSL